MDRRKLFFMAAVTAVSDTIAPSVPTGLTTTSRTTTTIILSWGAVTDPSTPVKYQLRRDGVTTVYDNTSTTYTDTSLGENTDHDYEVRAYDNAGNYSAWSAIHASYTNWNGPTFSRASAPASYSYYRLSSSTTSGIYVYNFVCCSSTNGGGTLYPPSNPTSYTTPTGYVWSAGYEYSSGAHLAWMAFTSGSDKWWNLGITVASTNWCRGQFPSAMTANSVKIAFNPKYSDSGVRLEGSNDGTTWTLKGTFGNIVGDRALSTLYTLNT
jgi:hypothetical protein